MSSHHFTLTPRDLLFMRDVRPMEASDAGLGANWPRPDQLWNAMINMMHRQWPERQEWEGEKHTCREGIDKHADSSFRFGALKVCGPFPMRTADGKSMVYFPCPLDLSIDKDGRLHPMRLVSADGTDMPQPLKFAFQAPVLGKDTPPQWLSQEAYCRYLNGEMLEKQEVVKLFTSERNIGVAIDPATGAAKNGLLYQAEYLRLEKDVSMAFSASCVIKGKHCNNGLTDALKKLMEEANRLELVMGGQQGVARLEELKGELPLPQASLKTDSLTVRWTLLTPLVSTTGWLPSWILPTDGKVMLKSLQDKPERRPGESRDQWRKRCMESVPDINAHLVAARIGKPMAFSGWDLQLGNKTTPSAGVPKKTLLAVPAGSCYVFECDSAQDVERLWKALNWQNQSSVFGEKGFGFGVCSSYKCN